MVDYGRLEITVSSSRNLKIERAGARVEATHAAAIALVLALFGALVRSGANMLVKLGADRRIIEQPEHFFENVLVFGG